MFDYPFSSALIRVSLFYRQIKKLNFERFEFIYFVPVVKIGKVVICYLLKLNLFYLHGDATFDVG